MGAIYEPENLIVELRAVKRVESDTLMPVFRTLPLEDPGSKRFGFKISDATGAFTYLKVGSKWHRQFMRDGECVDWIEVTTEKYRRISNGHGKSYAQHTGWPSFKQAAGRAIRMYMENLRAG